MSSRGRLVRRRSAVVSVVLAVGLSAGVTGCGSDGDGEKKPGKAKPTTTAGVTLTPSGANLELGEAATLKWVPNQNVTGLVDIAVTTILQGSEKDTAKVEIKPRPEGMRLYYVKIHLKNLGKTDLGGVSPNTLPLHLDEGADLLQQPASIDPKLKFDLCPSSALPAKFGKGAEADVCLVYVATAPIEKLLLQPEAGDVIEWPGTVTTPSPTPSKAATKKPAAKKPAAKAS
ncbi:hypothetical protein [Nocardioides cavernaquae]|nr:hypothetical protein [Nocardioides cavernaquae]